MPRHRAQCDSCGEDLGYCPDIECTEDEDHPVSKADDLCPICGNSPVAVAFTQSVRTFVEQHEKAIRLLHRLTVWHDYDATNWAAPCWAEAKAYIDELKKETI